MKGFLDHLKTFATFSEVFRTSYEKDKFISMLQITPLSTAFQLLSMLSSDRLNYKLIDNSFTQLLDSHDKFGVSQILKKRLENHILFSPQGLLNLWKWLFTYGDHEKLFMEVELQKGVQSVIYQVLIASDYLKKSGVDLKYEVMSNAAFNLTEDLGASIARTAFIYNILARQKSLYEDGEYLNFNDDFEKKYNYSLLEHLAVIYGMVGIYLKQDPLDDGWVKDIDFIFSTTQIAEKARDILSPLILSFNQAKEWSYQNLESTWNFMLFKQSPLFTFDGQHVVPISLKLLHEQMYVGLFHKVRHCYPENDKRFLDFFGKPFEKYIELLCEDVIKKSPLPYKFIPEFKYGKKKGKKSPDAFIKLGDKLLIIEVKSYRLSVSSMVDLNEQAINKDIKKMVINPIKQAHDRFEEILKDNSVNDFHDIKEIYIMVVNQGDFPTIPPIESDIRYELKNYFKLPIKSFFHVSIEEFEMLCYLIERKVKTPIFKILDNKEKLSADLPMKNFIINSSLPAKRPSLLQEQLLDQMEQLGKILFANFELIIKDKYKK